MTKAQRWIAMFALAAVLQVSCTKLGSGALNAKPADLYAAIPSVADVRKLLGDSTWWAGPPSFEVSPLDSATTPLNERFSVAESYVHIGTAELLRVRYTVYDTTSSAVSKMTDYQSAFGTSPSSPSVGDQVLYYGIPGGGATPVATRTFVRVGQIVVQIVWLRKDTPPTVQQLGKNASLFVKGLKNLGKSHTSAPAVAARMLPPPGLDITFLGSTQLSVESLVVMLLAALPDPVLTLLRRSGVSTFAYGDYALNNDTHMEVQTALLAFNSPADASAWATLFGPGTPDANGISSAYLPASGTPAAGEYHYLFSSGNYGVVMVCKASLEGEAASRECEGPMKNTALAWSAVLSGLN